MKPEILDRLLIDRELKALEPDVAALLEAYLEKEPGRMQAAEEIGETVRLARLACPGSSTISLPPLKFLSLPESTAAGVHSRRAWWPAELAAAFILGIGLAFWTLRPGEPATSTPGRNATVGGPREPNCAPAFWSIKRLASMESQPAPAPAPRLRWRSLVQNPQMND